ncbi:protein FREE1-like [Chenopodium quinoa]|uniref:FYVE-type domain-containing protein n=1 Tax=Chenopodium quinoa TaxID=63459 RepID=A0A803LIY2_CHEQI|nr:protein FREE1-like [Chenopodium quinoa]
MQQAGDFNSPPYYHPPQHHHHHQPPPPPTQYYAAPDPSLPSPPPPQPPSYASAPPFSGPNSYSAADYSSSYSQNYPPFPHSSDPLPPTAPPPQPHYPPAPAPSVGPDSYGAYPPPPPPPAQLQYPATTPYYPPYDPHQSAPPQNYSNPPPPPQNYPNPPNLNANSSYYEKSYDNSAKFDYGAGYNDENLSGYGSFGGSRSNAGGGYDYKDDGAYAYQGKSEPYGARGTGSKSSNWSGLFDDYGRAISFPSGTSKKEKEKPSSLKVVRAVPKAESNSDSKGGVQKFRVKLLPESGGQSVMDVLCMVGLDGIRMLDPNTSRTLRIYPLETVTRCDKYDSSTFAFWSKAPVDIEPRRIRLQSNSYTTNTLLDTVTAATVQFKEMGGRIRSSEPPKALDQSAEKKKGFADWMNKLKPVNEEKDHWVPDEAVSKCTGCGGDFSAFNRRHHCRNCGDVFCDKCTQGRTPLTLEDNAQAVRVCDRCMAHVTQRLSMAKEAASRPVSLQSHEDLAKKLQEEMEKNLRISSGTKLESSGKRMREVACPTCTVHLQVQVPSSGSETIECGVCQHPFLVSAH